LQLIGPDAQIALKDGSVLTIAADRGLYQRDRDFLELLGEVTLRRDGDLTVVTERANIDLGASSASGDQPVAATSPHGTLSGTGFRIAAGGDTVFVNGPAQMQIVPAAKAVLP
jgi:lipopolysaccharide export system protein LptC